MTIFIFFQAQGKIICRNFFYRIGYRSKVVIVNSVSLQFTIALSAICVLFSSLILKGENLTPSPSVGPLSILGIPLYDNCSSSLTHSE